MPNNYRIQQNFILIRVKAPSAAAADDNEMILGGLAAALGRVTHPIYSIVGETLGYVIAFR